MSVKIVQRKLPSGTVPYEDVADPVVKKKLMLLNRNIDSIHAQLSEVQRAAIELQQKPAQKQKEIEDIERYVAQAAASAEAAAESARAAALSATSAATAKTAAESARDTASGAKDAAVSAKNDAVTAKDAAVQAKADAESARDNAANSKTAAKTSEDNAAASASAASASASEAARSAAAARKLNGAIVGEASGSTSYVAIDSMNDGTIYFRNTTTSTQTVYNDYRSSSDPQDPSTYTLEPGEVYSLWFSSQRSATESGIIDKYKVSSTNVKVTKMFN